jgi:hypothetical protein
VLEEELNRMLELLGKKMSVVLLELSDQMKEFPSFTNEITSIVESIFL